MKKLMSLMMFVAALSLSSVAYGANEQSFKVNPNNMKDFRLHSSSHWVAGARNIQQFEIAGLAGGCTRVFLDGSKDAILFSALWTAYIKKIPFTLTYDLDIRTPWGDPNACAITSITFSPTTI